MESIVELRSIPGYKFVLKYVLKNLIQQLVNQLSFETDEETLILSMSISEGMISHLGTESGKMFLADKKDIKSQFYEFCLKHKQLKRDMSHDSKADQENFINTNLERPFETQQATPTQDIPNTPKSKNSRETKQPKPKRSRAKPQNFKIIGITEGPEPITIVEPHFPLSNKKPKNIRHEPYPKQRPVGNSEQDVYIYTKVMPAADVNELPRNGIPGVPNVHEEAVAQDEWRDLEIRSKDDSTVASSSFRDPEYGGNVCLQDSGEIESAVKDIINNLPKDLASLGDSSQKRKRKSKPFRLNLNNDNKLKVIERAHETGITNTAKEYGIPDSTLRGWIKQEEKLRASLVVPVGRWEQESMVPGVRDTELDAALFKWYTEAKDRGENITLPILQQEAEKISLRINPDNKEFRASTRWVISFKRRFGISLKM